ncbi:Trm112 family protein [Maridesulfovibrio sp.]|uniref:Trm112 family protein n=1 Tax=unclassified Maridesulfovibrio TaxID=2794999 RepID=UPI003B00CE19
MTLNKELIDILVCPKCKDKLELLDGESGLKCESCKVVYPVKDEIPIMLVDEAVPADQWEKK